MTFRKFEALTDEELAVMSSQGNTEASDCLIDRYKGYVRSLSHARYLIGGDNDDLIQEGMIGLMKAVRDYDRDKGAAFKTFATLCILRQQSTAIEAATRLSHEPLNQSVQLTDTEWETAFSIMKRSPEEIVVSREASNEIQDKIKAELSPFENQVLSLYLQERGYREIAEKLGKSPKNIDNAIQRIRKKVRQFF